MASMLVEPKFGCDFALDAHENDPSANTMVGIMRLPSSLTHRFLAFASCSISTHCRNLVFAQELFAAAESGHQCPVDSNR